MNKNPVSHIDTIFEAIDEWLQADNHDLKEAIDRTVNEGLFSFEDVKFQILALKESMRKKNLEKWASVSGLESQSLDGKKVLCLHAGNIPLVGIQDLLSVVMARGEYHGKISKNDPYLMPTILDKLRSYKLITDKNWYVNLEDFENSEMDAVLFAGSESSAGNVQSKLKSLGIINENTPILMRTAYFSVALVTDNKKETMEDLTEAVFRYGGNGCRSVAIVVAPFSLDSEKCTFTDYVEAFWLKNPQHQKPPKSLFHRFAYNKAMDIPQAWLNDFLIEENVSQPGEKFLLHWVRGGEKELETIIKKYKNGLQSVYSSAEYIGREIEGFRVEPLSQAQTPPVWWKPDRIDSIKWLQKNVAHQ